MTRSNRLRYPTKYFQEIKEHLTENGILMMNVIRISETSNNKLINPISNTISSVFNSTFIINIPKGNAIVIATKNKINKEELFNKLDINKKKELEVITNFVKKYLEEVSLDTNKTIFTDDKTPIEKLTYEMYNNK